MPISSLVIHLSAAPPLRARASLALAAHPAFLLGAPRARLLPAALDTRDEEENKACWRWLQEQPGVDHVEVLSVCFEAAGDEPRGEEEGH
ncbi:MAG: hypothetical protein AB7N76_10090 [Planctomycetota bacterium]